MAQDHQTFAMPLVPALRRGPQLVLGWATIGLLVAAAYYQVLGKLVTDWWQIPDFSHGFLVPFFAGYLVWEKRRILLATSISPAWSGIGVMALGLGVLILGVYGSELFLSRVSLLILLAGLVLCFGGWQLLRELRFALLVLVLAIPLPAIIFNQITFPLQILASKLAAALLPLCGVPVLREGNVLKLPVMDLEVAEACSGINSLMSLFTLAVFYGYFMEKSRWRQVVVDSGQHSHRHCGQRRAHPRRGIVRPVRRSRYGPGSARVFRLGHLPGFACLPLCPPSRLASVSHQEAADMRSLRFWSAVLLLAATVLLLHSRPSVNRNPPAQPLAQLPESIAGWSGHDLNIDQETLSVLGAGDFLSRVYTHLPPLPPSIYSSAISPPRGLVRPSIPQSIACQALVGSSINGLC